MGWRFWKRKVVKGSKVREVQVLGLQVEQVEQKEIQLVNQAMSEFSKARNQMLGSTNSGLKDAMRVLNQVQSLLLNARVFNQKVKKLAKRLEDDLVDLRDGTRDNRAGVLSTDELEILTFGQQVDANIDALVAKIKELESLLSARDPYSLEKVRNEEKLIGLGLQGLYTKLVNLYELEKKVEELTAAWVA